MKNKNIIILIISVVIVAIIALISVKIYHNNKELNVKLYYNTMKFDFETTGYIYNEIKLTNEQQEKIIEFYKKTDTKTHQHVKWACIGMIKLEFSDGNIITIDGNSYGYLEKHNGTDLIIELSNGFGEYILSIVEENRKEKEDG